MNLFPKFNLNSLTPFALPSPNPMQPNPASSLKRKL